MKIKHTLFALFLMLSAAFRAEAQSIVLCESYDAEGNASGIYTTWDIKADGGFIYILYKQPNTLNSSSLWYLYIDYDWDNTGKLTAYETITLTPERGKNWIVYDYKFKDVGDYRAYIMKDGVEQASVSFNIGWEEGVTPPASGSTTTSGTIDTYYYENSSITFCSSVDANGDAVNPTTSYVLPSGGTVETIVLLDNALKPLQTTLVYVDVYKDGATEPYDTFSINVQTEWDYCWFKLNLAAPGSYYVDLYTADDIFINTATLTVTR